MQDQINEMIKRSEYLLSKIKKYLELQNTQKDLIAQATVALEEAKQSLINSTDDVFTPTHNLMASAINDGYFSNMEFEKGAFLFKNCMGKKSLSTDEYNSIYMSLVNSEIGIKSSCSKLTTVSEMLVTGIH